MFEVVFLLVLAAIWILIAILQDLRTREVANWVNYSLIIFALGFRFFWSLFNGAESGEGFSFFYQGLVGFGIFFVAGNLLYYGRVFAGGDAKLMIAMGAILPFYNSFYENVFVFVLFILLFLVSGAIYGLISSFVLAFEHKKEFNKEFRKRFEGKKKIIMLLLVAGILFMVLGIREVFLFWIGIFIFVSPYLYLFAKSVDEACMVKTVHWSKLTEGDWLYKDIFIGKKKIKASWDGLTKEEIRLITKAKKEVLIKSGIPFTPVFLIAFIVLVYLLFLI